jgi:hypothetical protein
VSTAVQNGAHPWLLVAPWWRWQRQKDEEGLDPRRTRPVFQKYESPDFVNVFLKEPQRSLKFLDEVDRVFKVDLMPAPPPLSALFAGKSSRLFKPPGGQALDAKLSPTGVRKLFLETHSRHYLVACELHCDRPGLPTPPADEVCQAGLVVRRRRFLVPQHARKQAAALLKRITALRTQLGALEAKVPLRPFAADRRTRVLAKMKADGSLDVQRAQVQAELNAARAELFAWQDHNGVAALYEGWIADPKRPGLGAWQPVEETPQTLEESSFPLYHLFADPRESDHDAHGRTIYFGIVPVGGSDVDLRGTARFDDQSLYEVRCFVRRHDPRCPRTDEAPDCCGELVWSEASEPYKLANPNDLVGTSQRPVTVQMPDLHELAAQVAALPFGQASPVKFVQPQGLNFDVDDEGKPSSPGVGGNQICFFAIPLITIVAYFVLKLFLPVVVLLFGLFFLLQLKLCIPPSFAFDAGLDAELKAIPPSLDIDADFSVSILGQNVTTASLHADLKGVVTAATADMPDAQLQLTTNYSNAALLPLAAGMNATASASFQADAGVDLDANIEFEPRITAQVQLT